jgi:hypothetical protein
VVSRENVDIVQRVFEGWGAGDFGARCLAPGLDADSTPTNAGSQWPMKTNTAGHRWLLDGISVHQRETHPT